MSRRSKAERIQAEAEAIPWGKANDPNFWPDSYRGDPIGYHDPVAMMRRFEAAVEGSKATTVRARTTSDYTGR